MRGKGQAAMEFLMSYGWAILAAVIAIGALVQLGVFSPSSSSACTVGSPFYCDEHVINAGEVQMNIRNGGGQSFTINNIDVEGCTAYTNATTVADGDTTGALTITCSGLNSGDSVRKDISISYIKSGGTINQTATGDIRGVAN